MSPQVGLNLVGNRAILYPNLVMLPIGRLRTIIADQGHPFHFRLCSLETHHSQSSLVLLSQRFPTHRRLGHDLRSRLGLHAALRPNGGGRVPAAPLLGAGLPLVAVRGKGLNNRSLN